MSFKKHGHHVEEGAEGGEQAKERNKEQVDSAIQTHDPVAMENAPQGVERTMEMDAERVQLEIKRIPKKLFKMMKNAALANPVESKRVNAAKARKFYGS